MLYYLPYYQYHPNAPDIPTHQLVYVPPPAPYTRPKYLARPSYPSTTPTFPLTPRPSLSQLTSSSPGPITPMESSVPKPPSAPTDHDCVLRHYELTMRQQPVQARMCGVGDKSDRRPVDPTPIIQLKVVDMNEEEVKSDTGVRKKLRHPDPGPNGMSFMQSELINLQSSILTARSLLLPLCMPSRRRRAGRGASCYRGREDTLPHRHTCFLAVSFERHRQFRRRFLRISRPWGPQRRQVQVEVDLVRDCRVSRIISVQQNSDPISQQVFYCTTTFTDPFTVYSAKKFPGMEKSTALSKSFAEQGLKIRVRKDPRRESFRPGVLSVQANIQDLRPRQSERVRAWILKRRNLAPQPNDPEARTRRLPFIRTCPHIDLILLLSTVTRWVPPTLTRLTGCIILIRRTGIDKEQCPAARLAWVHPQCHRIRIEHILTLTEADLCRILTPQDTTIMDQSCRPPAHQIMSNSFIPTAQRHIEVFRKGTLLDIRLLSTHILPVPLGMDLPVFRGLNNKMYKLLRLPGLALNLHNHSCPRSLLSSRNVRAPRTAKPPLHPSAQYLIGLIPPSLTIERPHPTRRPCHKVHIRLPVDPHREDRDLQSNCPVY